MSQLIRHNYITLKRLMASKPFVTGFNDVRNKKPFRYDYFVHDSESWAYELGRQFAMNYIGKLKNGSHVSTMAEAAMADLMRVGIIN